MTTEALEENTLVIELFGGLRLAIGEVIISDSQAHTRQVWSLLEYLIVNRNRIISKEELIDALWLNGRSGQPANALKNLVYRIRTLLTASGVAFAKEIVSYEKGAYCINKKLNCTVDTEQFEQLVQRAFAPGISEDACIDLLLQALALYKGNFLNNSQQEEWVVPLTAYYRSIYFKCVHEAIRLFQERHEYAAVELLCQKALVIDPFEESIHSTLISALMKQGKQNQALAQYSYVTDLFYRELGVSPSESLRNLYREIGKTVNSVETDLRVIKEDLKETSSIAGAYDCDYEAFKNMYRVEARGAARSGQTVFIGLMTMTDPENGIPPIKLLNKMMKKLLSAIVGGLRKGDIVARFSATQYVLMLPAINYENGLAAMERLNRQFKSEYGSQQVKVHTTLLPLDPVE